MNFFEMMKQNEPGKTALIEDGIPYTYGELVELAVQRSQDDTVFSEKETGHLHFIRRKKILNQLVDFFACSERGLIPILVPYDARLFPEETTVPENVCMAVTTSGSTGTPKVLYRTYESWADFFPMQNEIFGIDGDSRLFAQGSLAFTGNLNLYMALFYAGGTMIVQNAFHPRQWAGTIQKEKVNAIYLIPSKLLCLPQVMQEENNTVKTILSGSQSLGKEDAQLLQKYFVRSKLILYYGASELNYITYVTDANMTENKNLIGKPFPGVSVSVREQEIYVDTPYHVHGITCPYTLSDKGYLDSEGNLYFAGRSDDIVGIRGRKVSTYRIEGELKNLEEVQEAAVLLLQEGKRACLTGFVILEKCQGELVPQVRKNDIFLGEIKSNHIFGKLRETLAHFEMPGRLIAVSELPRNESGKIDKGTLTRAWENHRL